MPVKFKSLPWILLGLVLAVPGVSAQNCRLSLSQPRIDYGAIRREVPGDSATLALGTRVLHVNVLCAEPAAMGLRFIGVAADGQGFQFGRQGRFRLSLTHAQIDGHAIGWAAAHLPGEPANGQLLPGQTLMARVAGMPMIGRRLTAQVEIDTELPADALEVRSQAHPEGRGSFELISPAVPPNQ
ncbi:hypothetical protein [Pseudomonas antarctica]|uniref:hypothetical protein n=1 Tax=Pseudomonas antarctica TaxID=219572 RepID=UPI003F7546E4